MFTSQNGTHIDTCQGREIQPEGAILQSFHDVTAGEATAQHLQIETLDTDTCPSLFV